MGNQNLSSTLAHLRSFGTLPSSAQIPAQDASQTLVLSLAASLLMGAALVGGPEALSSVQLVEQLTAIFPQLTVQQLIPIINLMIVFPIYYHSWMEATGTSKKGQEPPYQEMIYAFAKDVIKMVTDPFFLQATLIARFGGTSQLSAQNQERLAQYLKLMLIGVALSLLYSVEVGKITNGKFGGIEPEELGDLITGTLVPMKKSSKKFNLHAELTHSLINRARELLRLFSSETDREEATGLLLNYVNEKRAVNHLLDPVKVFHDLLTSRSYPLAEKPDMIKG